MNKLDKARDNVRAIKKSLERRNNSEVLNQLFDDISTEYLRLKEREIRMPSVVELRGELTKCNTFLETYDVFSKFVATYYGHSNWRNK